MTHQIRDDPYLRGEKQTGRLLGCRDDRPRCRGIWRNLLALGKLMQGKRWKTFWIDPFIHPCVEEGLRTHCANWRMKSNLTKQRLPLVWIEWSGCLNQVGWL